MKIVSVRIENFRSFKDETIDFNNYNCLVGPNGAGKSTVFYGASRGSHKLSPFIQWVFVPAVKDACGEQEGSKNTALGLLVERAVRSKVNFAEKIAALREKTSTEYDEILTANQGALNDLSSSLKQRLGKWSHPEVDLALKWDRDPNKSVRVEEPFAKIFAGECGFLGEIARLGHGLQRSYILALLEELAASGEEDSPRLLLGLEEPELFQHPPQAQHLAEVLQRLSNGKTQVTVCTHSPYFVLGKGFEDVRLVRKPRGSSAAKASRTSFADLSTKLFSTLGENRFAKPVGVQAKLHQVLQPAIREMFFAPTLVFVEGLEDVAYITSALVLQGQWDKWRQFGAHIVPVHGKSEFVQPLAIAQLLAIPTFVIFDADGNKGGNQQMEHQKDNERLLKLLKQPDHPIFPPTTSWQMNFVMWPADLGTTVQADYTHDEWTKWKGETEAGLGQPGGLGKNTIFISTMLTKAWDAGKPSATLTKLTEELLKFAQSATA